MKRYQFILVLFLLIAITILLAILVIRIAPKKRVFHYQDTGTETRVEEIQNQ